MKKTAILFFIFSLFSTFSANAQDLPQRQKVLSDMLLANEYFMTKNPNVGKTLVTDRERPSNIWTRGVYYEGLMALHQVFPKKEFYNYAVDWAEFHNWGMRNGNTTRNADDQCCGQTYIDLYNILPDPARIKNIKICMDMMVNTPQNDDWWWIDALQMAMPVFAKLGVVYNDDRYFNKMYEMYMFTRNEHGDKGLFNEDDGLWWRDADFDPPYTEPNGKDCYWSRGNGWVVAALIRVLNTIPENEKHREQYMNDYLAMMDALVPIQREDGFWNASLHDPTNYGGKELTGTSLFVYGMAWGINNGYLDREKYLPAITKAWNGLVNDCLHENGFLGYVQGTGKEPSAGQPVTYDKVPDFEDYGLGCFLLAGTEVYKMEELD
ncbi:Rhamnogalacturonyl hydrolase YesR [Tangfeifania diversioriginum]|uniref:Rhamnogalacturonyl hydrolase YesR n=1 Tax=Tangfeifania diversioriginum TaxID=1168035 RepID=A0A1M6BU80_9BACT|nr:glycoside hydrolase family 88 protein [Tangfeifania diversioriginum]SHI52290.1 Rhamnogalacturonyl hydrolase YesR [Tangfeifania diversioriginum]